MRILVGREREQRCLREFQQRAFAGHGSLVLVSGETDIGKTTLVDDLIKNAYEPASDHLDDAFNLVQACNMPYEESLTLLALAKLALATCRRDPPHQPRTCAGSTARPVSLPASPLPTGPSNTI